MKDQSEPQPPSDDSNGEEQVFIPPLFMALLHPEDYPQSVFIKALRPLWRSSTYQKILEEGRAEVRAEGRAEGRVEGRVEGRAEGRAEEARRFLRRQGTRRFGKPDAHIEAALDAIADLERLEQLSERVLEVTAWEELLAQP